MDAALWALAGFAGGTMPSIIAVLLWRVPLVLSLHRRADAWIKAGPAEQSPIIAIFFVPLFRCGC